MISIDTDVMRQLVSTAANANNAIDDAVEVLNQITVHNDWACKERKVINEYTIKNKQLIKEIQENSSCFLNILSSVASEFDGAEKTIIDLFQDIESVIAGVLGSVIWGAISTGDNHNHNPIPSIGDVLNEWTTPSVEDIVNGQWNPTPIYSEGVVVGPDGEIIAVPIVAPIDTVIHGIDSDDVIKPPSHVTPDPALSSEAELKIEMNPISYTKVGPGGIFKPNFDYIVPSSNFEYYNSDLFNSVIGGPGTSPYEMFELNNVFDSIHISDYITDLFGNDG